MRWSRVLFDSIGEACRDGIGEFLGLALSSGGHVVDCCLRSRNLQVSIVFALRRKDVECRQGYEC